jgi:heme exporter protein C
MKAYLHAQSFNQSKCRYTKHFGATVCSRSSISRTGRFLYGYWTTTILLMALGLVMLVLYTPNESSLGPVQKIFYLHLPSAITMFLAASSIFVSSVGYLWSRSIWWDDLAHASGEVTVLLCTVVLFTGMIWGKSEWGHWWTWSPRLTFSLVLWGLYVVYLVVRHMIADQTRRATICAVYGLVAFIDVPLVYVSVKLMPDVHPSSIKLEPSMQLTLLVWSVFIPLLMSGLIYTRFRLCQRIRMLPFQHSTNQIHTDLGGVSS